MNSTAAGAARTPKPSDVVIVYVRMENQTLVLSGPIESLSDGRAEVLIDEIVVTETPESDDSIDRRTWFKKGEPPKLKLSVPLTDLKLMYDGSDSPWEGKI